MSFKSGYSVVKAKKDISTEWLFLRELLDADKSSCNNATYGSQ